MAASPPSPNSSLSVSCFGQASACLRKCLSKRRQQGDQRRANAGILLQELRHQRERSCEKRGRIFCLALREQYAAEIVANLRVIRLEQQHALVSAHGVVELAQAFALGRVDEQLLDLIAGGIGGAGTGRGHA